MRYIPLYKLKEHKERQGYAYKCKKVPVYRYPDIHGIHLSAETYPNLNLS